MTTAILPLNTHMKQADYLHFLILRAKFNLCDIKGDYNMIKNLVSFTFLLSGILYLAGCDAPPPQILAEAESLSRDERVLQETQMQLAIFLDGSGLEFDNMEFNPADRNQIIATLNDGTRIIANVRYDESGKVTSVTKAEKLNVTEIKERFPLSDWKIVGPVPAPTDLQNRQIDLDMGHFAKKFKHDEGQLPYPTVLFVYDAVSADKSTFDVIDQPAGMLNFTRLWQDKPLEKTVCWAATNCQIAETGNYAVAIYFSGDMDLYLNGKKIVESESANPVRKVFSLPFEAGDNKIVARIYHENGEWPLAIKISDGPIVAK